MNWMIGNVCAKKDENGNVQPNKKKSTGKIDGPVALFTGMARALAGAETAGEIYFRAI
jgi:phage terminase large subunit-like protein